MDLYHSPLLISGNMEPMEILTSWKVVIRR